VATSSFADFIEALDGSTTRVLDLIHTETDARVMRVNSQLDSLRTAG